MYKKLHEGEKFDKWVFKKMKEEIYQKLLENKKIMAWMRKIRIEP